MLTRRPMMPVAVTIADMKVNSIMASITLSLRALTTLSRRTGRKLDPLKAQAISSPIAMASAMLRLASVFHKMTKPM